ncbi:MAG: hypothetical protein HAW60_06030 [Bdellovibrionales bacterium]|nr:hypothetical protein [Bdellovibrionales bacterium]
MTSTFLSPMTKSDLTQIFDNEAQQIVSDLLLTSTYFQPSELPGQQLPVHIPKEHIEQFCVQALGSQPVGAGSYPVDIIDNRGFGADIKMLSCKLNKEGKLTKSSSGETSLLQNFSITNLDRYFNESDYESIKNLWVKFLKNKYQQVFEDHPCINHLYYFFILRAKQEFYLTGCKLNLEELQNVTLNDNRSTENSVFLNGIIPEEFGNAKIYKAKKRLELRLCPLKWKNNYSLYFQKKSKSRPIVLKNLGKKYSQHWDSVINHFKELINNNKITSE